VIRRLFLGLGDHGIRVPTERTAVIHPLELHTVVVRRRAIGPVGRDNREQFRSET
jgi:hypothetical protein